VKVTHTNLPGVVVLEPEVYGDQRGFFMEAWNKRRYEGFGIPADHFVQDNLSYSVKGVLRGLHFQNPNAQGKLVSVLQGEVFDVAVDIRISSPTFGEWVGLTLAAENKHQLYVPEGFAHGFLVTSEAALFSYKCTDYYNPEAEHSLLWNDPELGIDWRLESPGPSGKDRSGARLAEIPPEKLPKHEDAAVKKTGQEAEIK
jgi:dTDP-4-dehydrorhamnose 3,5-epimerase